MKAPIQYYPDFVADADKAFTALQQELEWVRRDSTPRCEYYCNDFGKPYVYGVGKGQREYLAQPYHPVISDIRAKIEEKTKATFEVCFLNRYLNQKDQLGWHADDSPEMDDERPIAIVTFGVEREIWFRPFLGKDCARCRHAKLMHYTCLRDSDHIYGERSIYGEVEKLTLQHGSLCLMSPGMQDTWQHRIPKASFQCGERISLTYRGYVNI